VLKNSSCIYGQKKGKQIYTSNKEIEKKGNSPEGVLAWMVNVQARWQTV
jgi:hypothetical protein